MENYNAKAVSDAWDMVENFLDEVLEQATVGEVSNDYNNDYANGDSYHHETHIGWKSYSLLEAAEVLEQLSDHEETDYGLWEGLHDPREAIQTQAAYTYGNAVGYHWNNVIQEINDFLNSWEWDDEADRKENATKYIIILVALNQRFKPEDCDNMVGAALKDIVNLEWTSTLALCDWMDENDNSTNLAKKFRTLLIPAVPI